MFLDAAGIKKPDISILSEDFLLEIKGMEHKNVALETLKKLLNDRNQNPHKEKPCPEPIFDGDARKFY